MHEYTVLFESRLNAYKMLSALILKELDSAHIEQLRALRTPTLTDQTEHPKMAQGVQRLINALNTLQDNAVDTLAADYARIFLGAGCVDEIAAYPFESVYTSPAKLVCQDAYEAVYKLFRDEGLKKADKDLFEDHAGLEFTFMAHLCEKSLKAIRANDEAALESAIDQQVDFLKNHILNWVPRWTADIRKCPATDFYYAVSLIIEATLELDKELFDIA